VGKIINIHKKTRFDARNEISQNAFDDIVAFYNKNEKSFLRFENQFGVNLWFLNHFQTYFSYRNQLFKNETLKGECLAPAKRKISLITAISRIVYELLLMLIKYRRPQVNKTGHIIISKSLDIINGQNKRFGDLNYDRLHNRPLMDIKKKIASKDFAPKSMTSTDSIFLNYMFRFSFVTHLFKFYSQLNHLFNEISEVNSPVQKSKDWHILSLFSKNRFFFYIIYLRYKSLDFYFKKSNIKGILLSDENSPQQKVIQYAAYQNGIEIFGFQHGNIHPLHPAYIYGKYKTKPVLPTITFTWGSYFTDLLHKQGGYSKEKVKTVGRIPPPNNHRKINPLINVKDKIILYASQPQRDADIRYKLLADILSTVKDLNPRYTLVIRPHPNEKDNDFFNKVAKDVQFHDFIVDRESDLRTHFEICSILLVAFSTVGTEFIPYFKPLLVLDYLDQDLIKWVREGVGIPIQNREDLLCELSKYQLKIDKERYKSFINKYYIVSPKVLEKIKQYINERR
jgi:hypothetical protein